MSKGYRLLHLLLLLPVLATGQLCEGEMGAAALHEDFGKGHNFGPPLPAGATTYEYVTSFPVTGTYMVSNRTQLNGAKWHPGLDHTPDDGNGYMLLFDADENPGAFFNVVLDSLCPGTRYEFSAYAANLVTPSSCMGQAILPDIRFELRDTLTNSLLASLETGELPNTPILRWTKYGMTFTLPPGRDAVRLLLLNNAGGGCGNDIAIDDIRISICNPGRRQSVVLCEGESVEVNGSVYTAPGLYQDTVPGAAFCHDSILVTEVRSGTAELAALDTFICEGAAFTVGPNAYTEPGFYVDTLLNEAGCDSIVHLQLTAASLSAAIDASADSVALGRSVHLQASGRGEGPLVWSWQAADGLSCTDCPDPIAAPLVSTDYRLVVRDELTGCRDTLVKKITVLPCESVYTPNAFSPNNDGRNDTFRPLYGDCVQEVLLLEVYNRWGGLVFQSKGPDEAWDGRANGAPCHVGGYLFRAVVRLKDGKEQLVQGELQLLR
jgi:gliding motility-associated-like protein